MQESSLVDPDIINQYADVNEELDDRNDAFMNNFREAMPNQNQYNAENVGSNHIIGEAKEEQDEKEEVDRDAEIEELVQDNANTFVVEEQVIETK